MPSCTLYYGCPYDETDRPETVAILEADAQKYTPSYLQALLTTNYIDRTIRTNAPENIAAATKYCLLSGEDSTNRYYNVTGYRMLNNDVSELTMTLDPFLTYSIWTNDNSGFSINGEFSRLTPLVPNQEWNMIPEGFIPQDPLRKYIVNSAYPQYATDETYEIIACTIDIDNLPAVFRTLKVSATDGVISEITPEYKTVRAARTTRIGPNKYTSGYGLYEYSSGSEAIGLLNAFGLGSSIIGRYSIPKAMVGTYQKLSSTGTHIDAIYPKHEQLDVSLTKATHSGTINNMKAKVLNASLVIQSNLGADRAQYRWADISSYGATGGSMDTTSFYTDANLLDGGCPYLIPEYMYGSEAFAEGVPYAIRGTTWIKPGMEIEGAAGRIMGDYSTAERLSNITIAGYDADASMIKGALSAVASAATDGNGVSQTNIGVPQAQSYIGSMLNERNQTNWAINQERLRKAIYTPTYIPHENPGLGITYPNNFQIVIEDLSPDDMKRFDRYLTKYGYACSEDTYSTTVQTAMRRGKNFTYLQFGRVTCNTRNVANRDICTLISTLLQSGIRVWKTSGVNFDTVYNGGN